MGKRRMPLDGLKLRFDIQVSSTFVVKVLAACSGGSGLYLLLSHWLK
ncbi:hypothetical protein H8B15_11370 [Hymenobacter sp. BT507]|uniref:Uncharacterized protein n=1 Tax=Hymenobacter citatus TaxID=2763506 RepID=A0ABR7MKC5_9BACT|nr:hypothetical protein [Hymenobacter citatus]MBC6611529.1 hypothetical protein [Hymenobacter citatus]